MSPSAVKKRNCAFNNGNTDHPAGSYMFKVNITSTRARSEISSKLTIKTQNDVNDVVLGSLLLTLNISHTLF